MVFVSSMVDLQQPIAKSSPKSEQEHDLNSSLISDDDHPESSTSKDTAVTTGGGGGGEDECAVDDGHCLKPSGSSIKCESINSLLIPRPNKFASFSKGFAVMPVNDGFIWFVSV